jgi:hypothetical protein
MTEKWQREFWERVRANDRREFDATGKAVVTGETDAEHRERVDRQTAGMSLTQRATVLKAAMNAGCDEAERLGYGSALGYVEAASIAEKAASVAIDAPADLMRETRIARARGLAMAIAECRDDARLDGIREGAAEIVSLLGEGQCPRET